ncbi:aldehyde ferredoxin oxidoreductase N-terminal domain-containing protein [Hydrogenimonas sp.]
MKDAIEYPNAHIKGGYAGKILHLKLSTLSHETIPTERYAQWGGGNGLGTAIFWDYCEDKTITDGRCEENVVVLATSPLCGTNAPAAGGRCEVVGVGYGQIPIGWFTRSNFGGRYSSMMKYAGWDAVVISGKAPHPVWVEVTNDTVVFHDARGLWGKGTKETQLSILARLDKDGNGWGWQPLPGKKDVGVEYSTQRPAVCCIGPAGENQSMFGCLVHDLGNGAGQGGFGAVWGYKNLKAISFFGSGGIKVADPMALVEARFQVKERYAADVEKPDIYQWGMLGRVFTSTFVGLPSDNRRMQACMGCVMGCRSRYDIGYGNEVSCQETSWYGHYAAKYAGGDPKTMAEVTMQIAEYCNDLGINSYPFEHGLDWLERLWHEGWLGKGKKVHTDLDFGQIGSLAFGKALLEAVAYRKDIGEDLAEGFIRAAVKWGREEDTKNGNLLFPYWGMPEHGYDPRAEVEWGFGSIMTDRDINSHEFNPLFWKPTIDIAYGRNPRIEAEEVVKLVAEKLEPYVDGPKCLDYSDENIYSDAVMNLTRWFIHYSRFWKNSALFCDLRWADLFDTNAPGNVGATADPTVGEQVFWNAVTGEGISFLDGLARGHRIFLLQNAIWALQGCHRDMVKFANYIYEKKMEEAEFFPFYFWPCRDEHGNWSYQDVLHRHLDRDKFEEWKSRFYAAEGMDPTTGWPTRKALEAVGLGHVADELHRHGKLQEEA